MRQERNAWVRTRQLEAHAGAAGQAKNHLLALMQVRKLKTVKVYSRNPENRKQFCDEMGPITPGTSVVDAARAAA